MPVPQRIFRSQSPDMAVSKSTRRDSGISLPGLRNHLLLYSAALALDVPSASPGVLLSSQAARLVTAVERAHEARRGLKASDLASRDDAVKSRTQRPHRPYLPSRDSFRVRGASEADKAVKRCLVTHARLQSGAKRWRARTANDEDYVGRLDLNDGFLLPPIKPTPASALPSLPAEPRIPTHQAHDEVIVNNRNYGAGLKINDKFLLSPPKSTSTPDLSNMGLVEARAPAVQPPSDERFDEEGYVSRVGHNDGLLSASFKSTPGPDPSIVPMGFQAPAAFQPWGDDGVKDQSIISWTYSNGEFRPMVAEGMEQRCSVLRFAARE